MTEDIENLILEHLRATRTDIGQIKDDLSTVKQRITSVETQVAPLHLDNAIVHNRIYAERAPQLLARGRHGGLPDQGALPSARIRSRAAPAPWASRSASLTASARS